MNESLLGVEKVPLFDAQVKEVATRQLSDGVEIIKLGSSGFEKVWPGFWFMFDWSVGWLLAEWIRIKSLRVVLQNLSLPEDFVQVGQNNGEALHQARQSFGSNRVEELFEMRTRGFNAGSRLMQHFCKHVAEAGSLDDVYNALGSFCWNGKRVLPLGASPDCWSNFYLNCPNGQAVRNRYRQVARLYYGLGGGRTLSIACGSAQPLIHALQALKLDGRNQDTELVLTDASPNSLAIAESRAEEAGVRDQVFCRRIFFTKLGKELGNEKFDIVEACGIFDYLSDDQVITLLNFAFGSLNPNGKIIVSNMNRTRGANVLLKMYNWPINYRSPEELGCLIKRAGGQNIKIYVEPWNIHPVATAEPC